MITDDFPSRFNGRGRSRVKSPRLRPVVSLDMLGSTAASMESRPLRGERVVLMKLSLVVAQGVHEGKVIPVNGDQFSIGRDPKCHLRPSSPAISKNHCAFAIRDGKVFLRDTGSTNGTFVNDEKVESEREVKAGDRVKAGPLEFLIRVDSEAAKPNSILPTAPSVSAMKLPEASAETAALVNAMSNSDTVTHDAEALAAMLLSEDSASPDDPSLGATMMEIPSMDSAQSKEAGAKPKAADNPNTSKAAADILAKYIRRPRA